MVFKGVNNASYYIRRGSRLGCEISAVTISSEAVAGSFRLGGFPSPKQGIISTSEKLLIGLEKTESYLDASRAVCNTSGTLWLRSMRCMERIGILSIDDNSKTSKLDEVTLAVEGAQNPFGAATQFLENHGFLDRDQAKVTGDDGDLGDVKVFFMTDAAKAPVAIAAGMEAIEPVAKPVAKKAAPKKHGFKSK